MQFVVALLTKSCPNQNKTDEYIVKAMLGKLLSKHGFLLTLLLADFVPILTNTRTRP